MGSGAEYSEGIDGSIGQGLRSARAAVSTYFVAMGFTFGVWVARIPSVKEQAHLTDASLGLALLATPIGLLAGTILAGRLVDGIGSARITRLSGLAICLLYIVPGLVRNIGELAAALLAVGFGGGLLDVAQNAQGVRVETGYGRPVLTLMHAGYSLGAIIGSLFGGAFAWAAIGPVPTLAASGIPSAIATVVAGRWLLPEEPKTADLTPEAGRPDGQDASRRDIRRLVLALGILGICGLIGEGAAGDWSAVYLRESLGTSAGFAALGYAAFSVMMTAGRFAGNRLIARFGEVRLVRACGLVAGLGLTAGLAVRQPVVAVAGFALLGAGLSVTIPRVFAAGGHADPQRPGRGLATVVGMGYAGMTGGPPLIGFLAGETGLRLALGIPALLALGITFGAPVLGTQSSTA
ncbi:MAG: MFS transporter [Streptosporangiaceae bacterium]|jgi:fucose permease